MYAGRLYARQSYGKRATYNPKASIFNEGFKP